MKHRWWSLEDQCITSDSCSTATLPRTWKKQNSFSPESTVWEMWPNVGLLVRIGSGAGCEFKGCAEMHYGEYGQGGCEALKHIIIVF